MPKILKILKNKYVLVTLVFLVVMFFWDENNVIVTSSLKREVRKLHKEEAMLKQEIAKDSIQAIELKNNLKSIETYGREVFYLKKANEDIFVIKR